MSKAIDKEVLVYADWFPNEEPRPVGTLWFSSIRGKSVFSFEYVPNWIENGIAIDPELPLYAGIQFAGTNGIFGVFKDSSPDRWGELLMKRREILLARKEKRPSLTMQSVDFLMGVHDSHRMGGLRFKEKSDGNFLNDDSKLAAPPWTSLRDLEFAVEQYENNAEELDEDSLKWINQLIAPGSSLGGARPKADVLDASGDLWIAKFPSQNDDSNVGLWEMLVHELAYKAGIQVPKAEIKKFSSSYHTFLSKRFDRTTEGRRIHFSSAMTLLQRVDGDDANSGVSYLDLVGFIKSNGSDVRWNLEELFRRVLFNVCVSNTDDHLRNHGFIWTDTGWILSPAYDMNPNETGTGLKLNIDEEDNSLDLDLVMRTAPYYLISDERARGICSEVQEAVGQWRIVAKRYGLSGMEMERKAEAFRG
jgi:serine/threonine-protein kinase HipA